MVGARCAEYQRKEALDTGGAKGFPEVGQAIMGRLRPITCTVTNISRSGYTVFALQQTAIEMHQSAEWTPALTWPAIGSYENPGWR